jgi:hypothetical protein
MQVKLMKLKPIPGTWTDYHRSNAPPLVRQGLWHFQHSVYPRVGVCTLREEEKGELVLECRLHFSLTDNLLPSGHS